MAKRKSYTGSFKLQVALSALTENSTSVTAMHYDVAPALVSKWKQLVFDHGPKLFEKTPDKKHIHLKRQIEKLEQMVRQREVEIGLLKNFQDFYESQSGP